jgi:RNA-directed DNA polymerase
MRLAQLLDGSYQPKTVRGVEIPKPGGGNRQLGIPTVVDRLVQQAILQVLEPILDPTFSPSGFGFRPGKSAHQALAQAQTYVADGREIVVDMDLEKFFDRVNHDILMARVARRIGDKRLLRIIRRFLEAGMMQNGVCIERHEGTPQGGPLSPLLANLLLDDLDKELERRGHRFCRYADDCNIYVQSQAAGERVMASIVEFLEDGLRLKVNRKKSAVAPTKERSFLGHRLLPGGRLGLASACQSRHDVAVVCGTGTRQPSRPSCRVTACWKPPGTVSTLGGMRGGDREESPHSIPALLTTMPKTSICAGK